MKPPVKPTQPMVTEHAILRYAERVMGLDRHAITEAILTPSVKLAIRTIGSGKFPIPGNCKAVVVNGSVVTVTLKDE